MLPQGYAESKWVGERILAAASSATGVDTVCVRVGQLCGGVNGYWNEKEWFPAIIKSGRYTGCLPTVEGVSPLLRSFQTLISDPRVHRSYRGSR